MQLKGKLLLSFKSWKGIFLSKCNFCFPFFSTHNISSIFFYIRDHTKNFIIPKSFFIIIIFIIIIITILSFIITIFYVVLTYVLLYKEVLISA